VHSDVQGALREREREREREIYPVSPFLAVFLGGVLGGIASGLVINLWLVLFGRRVAEGLLRQQVAYLETRFKENVIEAVLGRVASFLDQGERIGQIVKRVVEILQLLFRPGAVEGPTAIDAASVAQQGLRDIAAFASEPAATP
jgi:hypothetical protein